MNWLLMLLAFALGALVTWLWSVRTVTRVIPASEYDAHLASLGVDDEDEVEVDDDADRIEVDEDAEADRRGFYTERDDVREDEVDLVDAETDGAHALGDDEDAVVADEVHDEDAELVEADADADRVDVHDEEGAGAHPLGEDDLDDDVQPVTGASDHTQAIPVVDGEDAADADSPYGPGSALPAEDGSGPEGWAIKGNADSGLFHTEDSPGYASTRAEVWFADEESAVAAGFRHWDRKQR